MSPTLITVTGENGEQAIHQRVPLDCEAEALALATKVALSLKQHYPGDGTTIKIQRQP
jgi:hypothetical protein